jgi:hypothetical protein
MALSHQGPAGAPVTCSLMAGLIVHETPCAKHTLCKLKMTRLGKQDDPCAILGLDLTSKVGARYCSESDNIALVFELSLPLPIFDRH